MNLIGLVDNFGSALLEYICATGPGAFPQTAWEAQFAENRPTLEPRQQEVLNQLERMDPPAGQPRVVIPSTIVVSVGPESGHVVANVLRLHAGGELPDVTTDDPVLAPLLAIAVEGFPSLLITNEQIQRASSESGSFGTWASDITEGVDVVFYRHPRHDEALAAIDADAELSALFGDQIDQEIRGRAHDARSMAGALLQAAALSVLASSADLSAAGLVAETRRQVEETRRLGRGERVEGSVLVGLFGISLSDDVASVDLPSGTLTSPKPRLRMIGSDSTPHGGQTASALLTIPMEINPRAFDRSVHDRIGEAVRSLGLATLMADGRAGAPVPLAAWTTRLGPIQDGSTSSGSVPLRFPQPAATPLDRARAQAVQEWSRKIGAVDPAKLARIKIAIDRIITAVSEHADTGDALLDAVMVWENLFGSKEETTFKVIAALTMITVPEPANRAAVLKNLRATYTARSNFVHAAETMEQSAMAEHRDRAIDTGLDALRIVLSTRDDLLARTSSKRAEAVLLGLPRDGQSPARP